MDPLILIVLLALSSIALLSGVSLGYCLGVAFGNEKAREDLREHFDTLENEHHTD